MENASVGIIGGADGPTEIFVAGGNMLPMLLMIGVGLLALLVVGGIVFAVSHRGRDED